MKKLLTLALLVGCSLPAHADLSFTVTTTSSYNGMSLGTAANSSNKMAMKGGQMRMDISLFGSKSIIISGASGGVTQINPAAKIFTVSSGAPKFPGGTPMGTTPSEITVTVKRMGSEKIRGINAPHWIVDNLTKINTPHGLQTMRTDTEIWSSTTPYAKISGAASMKFPFNLAAMMNGKAKFKGDVKNMKAAYAMVPLRMKIQMGEQATSTLEYTNISTKTLPPSLFKVPLGYRKVSAPQFQQAQQAAMMGKMGGIFKGMGGMPKHMTE